MGALKSYVSMEQHQCPVCFDVFETGAILMDKRLKESMEQFTVTGQSLCPTCTERKDQGYVALVEADERTRKVLGRVVHVRATVFNQIFPDLPVPKGMVAYVESGVVDMLMSMQGAE